MSKKEKKKVVFEDTGETVADMNVEGFKWYQSKKTMKQHKKMMDLNILPHERRAIIKGALIAYLPTFLIILVSFVVVYLLFYFWAISVR